MQTQFSHYNEDFWVDSIYLEIEFCGHMYIYFINPVVCLISFGARDDGFNLSLEYFTSKFSNKGVIVTKVRKENEFHV